METSTHRLKVKMATKITMEVGMTINATMERVINTQEGITQANIATQFGSRGTSKVEAFHILCAESKLSLR